MGKYHTIIFDLDGTLLDTLDDLTDSVNYALRSFGMQACSKEEIKARVGNGVRVLMQKSVPDGENNPQFEEVFATFKEYYALHCNDKTKPYEGILALLERLKQEGYALALVSNKLDAAVKTLCDVYFAGLFGAAVGQRDEIEKKPAPDMVFAALDELGQEENSAIYVGDSEVDIETARRAGMPCISVLWGFRDRDFLEEQGAMLFARVPEDICRLVF